MQYLDLLNDTQILYKKMRQNSCIHVVLDLQVPLFLSPQRQNQTMTSMYLS